MNRARWTPAASDDVLEIYLATARFSPRSADALLDRLHEVTDMLAHFHLVGTARDDLMPGLRIFPVGNYLVCFYPKPDGIEVARVVDGRRNYPALFK